MNAFKAFSWSALCAAFLAVTSCGGGSPQVGSQTNWLRACDTSADCGKLTCVCGVCTSTCTEDADCSGLGKAECASPSNDGAIAACGGKKPSSGMCMVSCDGDAACPAGSLCVAGACAPAVEASAEVTIDPSASHQTLIGFGASLAYGEDTIVAHPEKAALFDAMFSESGFDVVRFGNRYAVDPEDDLQVPAEIIAAAETRLGRMPTLFMTSGSPPDALKANGDRYCANGDATCTLVRDAGGGFDYAGFAEYWRASLEAYEAAGIHPDYVSLQNNTDWIPSDEGGAEACRFLPEEGTGSVRNADGDLVQGEYPGFDQALAAVLDATSSLGKSYAFTAAEAGSAIMVPGYANTLAPATYGAFAFHLYLTDPRDVDIELLERVRSLGEGVDKPIIQSEMVANGLDTAILAQYALTVAGASAYLQASFVGSDADEESGTLISVAAESFETLPAYHALAHFARSTDPGWLRVDAASDSNELLSSAWLSPDENALTIVLVNSGDTTINAQVSVPEPFSELLASAVVTRTTFDGVERSSELGVLSSDRIVRLPGHAIATVAATGD